MLAVLSIINVSLLFKNTTKTEELPQQFQNCSLCSGLSPKHGNSTPEDLVLAGIFGGHKRVATFLRSLRSVGCQAHVVLITNLSKDAKSEPFFNACGAELFQMKIEPEMMNLYPHSLRYIGYEQYLNTTTRKFNRILHSDSFDVFFQKDPFNSKIRNENLFFAMEKPLIKDSTWNTGWLERAYGNQTAKDLANFRVSCSGTVIGGAEQFSIYLRTLLSHEPFWRNGRHSLDQAYHNYLLHTKEFEKNGVKAKFLGCDSMILTMHYCSRYGHDVVRGDTIYTPNGIIAPAIVHQYNLFQQPQKVVNRVCK